MEPKSVSYALSPTELPSFGGFPFPLDLGAELHSTCCPSYGPIETKRTEERGGEQLYV